MVKAFIKYSAGSRGWEKPATRGRDTITKSTILSLEIYIWFFQIDLVYHFVLVVKSHWNSPIYANEHRVELRTKTKFRFPSFPFAACTVIAQSGCWSLSLVQAITKSMVEIAFHPAPSPGNDSAWWSLFIIACIHFGRDLVFWDLLWLPVVVEYSSFILVTPVYLGKISVIRHSR